LLVDSGGLFECIPFDHAQTINNPSARRWMSCLGLLSPIGKVPIVS